MFTKWPMPFDESNQEIMRLKVILFSWMGTVDGRIWDRRGDVIRVKQAKVHLNYFLALERDMEAVSRYIEFAEDNLDTYSIELAHLLFAASSEVDVIAKAICRTIAPDAPAANINQYRAVLVAAIPDFPEMEVFIPRYGLTFKPWEAWGVGDNPNWWRSYNKVKHERDAYFNEATLQNALNALGGLLVMTFHFYRLTPVSYTHLTLPTKRIV